MNNSHRGNPAAQLISIADGAGRNLVQPVQRKQLSPRQRQQLVEEKSRFAKLRLSFRANEQEIVDNMALYEQNLAADEMLAASILREDMERKLASTAHFFEETQTVSRNASNSDIDFKKLVASLNWYEHSGGRNAVSNLLSKTRKLAAGKEAPNQRTLPGQVDAQDERFFDFYMRRSRPPLTVYRGDGRGIDLDSLDHFSFEDVEPGGTRDISYFGMVEHQHSNTAKNGMVSTTSSFDVAHFWATQKQKYGIVYEMVVDDYLHVANLMSARNFKDRYPGQFEILIPGAVPASKIVSATLYAKSKALKKITR